MEVKTQSSLGKVTDQGVARTTRRWPRRLTGVLLGAAGVFALGIYDDLKGGLVSGAADWVRYKLYSPVYIVELSDVVPVLEGGVTLRPFGERDQLIRPERVSLGGRVPGTNLVRFLEIKVYPGSYFVTLERTSPSGTIVLSEQPVFLGKTDGIAKINTAPSQWTSRTALTSLPPGSGAISDGASRTRWVSAPSDAEALAATEGRSAAILRAALGQLGVWDEGGDADRKAINAYWEAARAAGGLAPSPSDSSWTLWGGAFLAWAVAQGGGSPPSNAAAFRSWRDWGVSKQPSEARPGMIVVVETGQRQAPAPSGLMVGIYLRRHADCVEIVTGNMADRVAVTCVRGKVLDFKSAG